MRSNQRFKQIPHREFCTKIAWKMVNGTKFQSPKFTKYKFEMNLNQKKRKQINIT